MLAPHKKSFRLAFMKSLVFRRITKRTKKYDSVLESSDLLETINLLGNFSPRTMMSGAELIKKTKAFSHSATSLLAIVGLLQVHGALARADRPRFGRTSYQKCVDLGETLRGKFVGAKPIYADMLESLPTELRPKGETTWDRSWRSGRQSAAFVCALYCWGKRNGHKSFKFQTLIRQLRDTDGAFIEFLGMARFFDEIVLADTLKASKPDTIMKQRTPLNTYPAAVKIIPASIYDPRFRMTEFVESTELKVAE